jgi:hypothetical protein
MANIHVREADKSTVSEEPTASFAPGDIVTRETGGGAHPTDATQSKSDGSTYTEGGTSYVAKTSFDVNQGRESITVSGDVKTSNGSHAASLKVVDTTNSDTLLDDSTTNTSLTTLSADADVSGKDAITVEFKIKIADSSATATLENASLSINGVEWHGIALHALDGDHIADHERDYRSSLDDFTYDPVADDSYEDTINLGIIQPKENGMVMRPYAQQDDTHPAPSIERMDTVILVNLDGNQQVVEKGYTDDDSNTYDDSNNGDFLELGVAEVEMNTTFNSRDKRVPIRVE